MKTSAVKRIDKPEDSRAELSGRIAARKEAAEALEHASDALKRAQDAAGAARADLDGYADLDNDLATARAAKLKRGESGPLPDDLIEQRNARNAAIEKLKECSGALEVLQREHVDAEKALRSATEAVSLEAYRVLLLQAASMGDELNAAKRKVWSLTHRLLAIDSLIGSTLPSEQSFGLRTRTHQEHQRIMSAINAVEPQWVANSPNEPQAQARWRWKGIHTALLADPNASIDFDE